MVINRAASPTHESDSVRAHQSPQLIPSDAAGLGCRLKASVQQRSPESTAEASAIVGFRLTKVHIGLALKALSHGFSKDVPTASPSILGPDSRCSAGLRYQTKVHQRIIFRKLIQCPSKGRGSDNERTAEMRPMTLTCPNMEPTFRAAGAGNARNARLYAVENRPARIRKEPGQGTPAPGF